jgi:hypothetical protein
LKGSTFPGGADDDDLGLSDNDWEEAAANKGDEEGAGAQHRCLRPGFVRKWLDALKAALTRLHPGVHLGMVLLP